MSNAELLAPAGEESALIAAVQNGADAVYVGGRLFGARAGASNFDGETLARSVEYCHKRNVRLYMTVNTLVRDSEMDEVYRMVCEAVQAGIDAAIVQDLGVAQMLKACFPDLHLHASTQMSIASAKGALAAKEMGFARVVPARECTLEDLSGIAQTGLEVEAFVHGALCVGYSGQCLLSSMIGGRSGNRGRCAQPCRLPYTMQDKKKYFLSPADLCTLEELPQLLNAGVYSLKIEGRLKRPEYVAVVTAAYRRALDDALAGRTPDKTEMDELLRIFNRGGFTRGYAFHKNDAGIMATARPNHWGVKVGLVQSVGNGRARVKLNEELHNGDGLEARGKMGDHGILVQGIDGNSIRVPQGVQVGDVLYRTTDVEQLKRAQASYEGEHRRTAVDAAFTAYIGNACQLTLGGCTVRGEVVAQAKGRPLEETTVRRQLEKLGDTTLELGKLTCDIEEGAFMPMSALNALRREAAQQCEEALLEAHTPGKTVLPYAPMQNVGYAAPVTQFILQSDSVEELLDAQNDADELYYAPRDVTFAALEAALGRLPDSVCVVLPAMLSDAELEEAQRAIGARRVVCSNLAQMQPGFVADIGLNAFNMQTARRLMDFGARRVTASAECTLQEAEKLASAVPTELIVHGDFPLMTLRHCPIRTEKGLDERGREDCTLCGRTGTVLTDRKGEEMRLMPYHAKSGCRMQVFNSHLYCALPEMRRIVAGGFAALRIIGTREDLLCYRRAANGEEVIGLYEKTTFGHLFRGVE